MRRILLIAAMLLPVSSAMATVTITANAGSQFDIDGVAHKPVTISYTTDVDIRAFALDINVDNGTNIGDNPPTGFLRGESPDVNGAKGYGIFPGRFRDFINPTVPDWDDNNYMPLTPWNSPGAENTGLGWSKIVVELGTLYSGDANKPALSGNLLTFDVNSEGQTDCNLRIAVNALRGGIVGSDANQVTATNLPYTTQITFSQGCTVPNVVDVPEATATAAIVAAGYVLGTRTTSGHDTIIAGNVISTNPAGGATPDCGTAVAYVVSTGPCAVPNVVNNMLESPVMNPTTNAISTLTNAGFTLGTRTTSTHATIIPGRVISTTPAAGATPGCGTAVAYVVSTGPGVCATCVGDLVPNSSQEVSDMSSLKAKLVNSYNRIGLYKATQGDINTGDQWHVCGNVIAGTTLEVSDMSALKARLVDGYNKGGLYKWPYVPNVVGLTRAAAVTQITAKMLTVNPTDIQQCSNTVPAGSVISSNPAYPTYRNCNTSVQLTVSTGPCP